MTEKIRLPSYHQGFKELDLRAAATHEMTHAFCGGFERDAGPGVDPRGAGPNMNRIRSSR